MMSPTAMCREVLRGGTSWSFERKLETGRNNEADDAENFFEKAEEE